MKADKDCGLTVKRLKALLHYDPGTGEWTRLVRVANVPAGSKAGTLKASGYRMIDVDGRRYRAHRLAWLYMTGEWPPEQIDHRDGDRSNNRWCNLRPATNQQNGANSRRPKNNTSGFKGVFWSVKLKKWAAKINPSRKQVHLGFFDDPSDAHKAYVAASRRYYGEFARAE